MTATAITENIEQVKKRIEAVLARTGRGLGDIKIVAVTKSARLDQILEAQTAGIQVFAENRVQEAQEKAPQVPAEWHMIGHLQSNKIKSALGLFQCVQSVDAVQLAKEINAQLLAEQKTLPVLLEVNTSQEKQKFGFDPQEIYSAVDEIRTLTQLEVRGLMGIAPNTADAQARRAAFKKLKNVFVVLKGMKGDRFQMQTLSMGMSDDFEIALEEGSNMLRLGRVIFGGRK